MSVLSREEWERRFAVRLCQLVDISERMAKEAANTSFDEADCFDTPEDSAEDEFSYWVED